MAFCSSLSAAAKLEPVSSAVQIMPAFSVDDEKSPQELDLPASSRLLRSLVTSDLPPSSASTGFIAYALRSENAAMHERKRLLALHANCSHERSTHPCVRSPMLDRPLSESFTASEFRILYLQARKKLFVWWCWSMSKMALAARVLAVAALTNVGVAVAQTYRDASKASSEFVFLRLTMPACLIPCAHTWSPTTSGPPKKI